MAWDELAKAFVSLLLITDPLGNLPLFMAVTEHCEERQRRKVFTLATFVAFAILLVFALMGAGIFHLFGVTLADLQVAGGLLLLLIAVRIVWRGIGQWKSGAKCPSSRWRVRCWQDLGR